MAREALVSRTQKGPSVLDPHGGGQVPLTADSYRSDTASLPVYTTGSQRTAATAATAGSHSRESIPRSRLPPRTCSPADSVPVRGRAGEESRQLR